MCFVCIDSVSWKSTHGWWHLKWGCMVGIILSVSAFIQEHPHLFTPSCMPIGNCTQVLPLLSVHYTLFYVTLMQWLLALRMCKEHSFHRSSRLLTTLVMHTSYLESLSRESEQGKDHCTSLKNFMAWDIADVLESVQHWVFPTCDWETFQRALHLLRKLKAHFNHMKYLNVAVSTYFIHKLL